MELTSKQIAAKKKSEALSVRILEECKRQNLTFYEFEWLVLNLGKALGDPVQHILNKDSDELFYPCPVDESPKQMVTIKGTAEGGWKIVNLESPPEAP